MKEFCNSEYSKILYSKAPSTGYKESKILFSAKNFADKAGASKAY